MTVASGALTVAIVYKLYATALAELNTLAELAPRISAAEYDQAFYRGLTGFPEDLDLYGVTQGTFDTSYPWTSRSVAQIWREGGWEEISAYFGPEGGGRTFLNELNTTGEFARMGPQSESMKEMFVEMARKLMLYTNDEVVVFTEGSGDTVKWGIRLGKPRRVLIKPEEILVAHGQPEGTAGLSVRLNYIAQTSESAPAIFLAPRGTDIGVAYYRNLTSMEVILPEGPTVLVPVPWGDVVNIVVTGTSKGPTVPFMIQFKLPVPR